MKKLLTIALVICLVSLFIIPQTFAATKVVFWDMFSGGDGEFMTAMIKEFNKTHPNIMVEETVVKWDEYYNRLLTALVAKKGPDLGIMHTSHIPAYASKSVLMPLDSELTKYKFPVKDFGAGLWEGGKYNGKQYAIPLDVHPAVMYYNKDILAKAGFMKDGKPQIPNTPDQFVNFLKEIKAKTGKLPLSLESNGFGSYRTWYGLMYQAGGSLLSNDNQKVTVNSEAGLKTLSWWVKTLKEFNINTMNYDESIALFQQGEAALHINGAWVTGGFEQQTGLNFGAMPFPSLFGGKESWGNSHNFIIPQPVKVNQAKVKAVLTFVDWMTANSDKWALAGHIPSRYSVLKGEKYNNLPYRSGYAAQMENIAYLPAHVKMLEIETIIADEIAAAYAGSKAPAQALSTIEEKVGELLK